jgi:hypothetical protein
MTSKKIMRYVATSGNWRQEFSNQADAIKWARDLAKDGWVATVRTLSGKYIKSFNETDQESLARLQRVSL